MLPGSKVSLLKAGSNPLLHHPHLAQYQTQSKYFKNDSWINDGIKTNLSIVFHLQNWIDTWYQEDPITVFFLLLHHGIW